MGEKSGRINGVVRLLYNNARVEKGALFGIKVEKGRTRRTISGCIWGCCWVEGYRQELDWNVLLVIRGVNSH